MYLFTTCHIYFYCLLKYNLWTSANYTVVQKVEHFIFIQTHFMLQIQFH